MGAAFRWQGEWSPSSPQSAIFDLAPLGRFDARPGAQMAYEACESASPARIGEGSIGAGTGATVGKAAGVQRAMKSGVGCWIERVDEIAVGAIAVVNAIGDVRDSHGQIVAGARGEDGGFVDSARLLAHTGRASAVDAVGRNTTLAVVATNAVLSRVEVQQLATAATAAFYRRITPAGTVFDGDVVFALCRHEGPQVAPVQVETLAVGVLEFAIERAVRLAIGREGIPGLADQAIA